MSSAPVRARKWSVDRQFVGAGGRESSNPRRRASGAAGRTVFASACVCGRDGMLVIRRRPGESLVIGDEIEVEVLEASPSQVKLGIRAPKSIAVLRKEIYVVGRQNQAASQEVSGKAVEKLLASLKKPGVKPISPL